MKPMKPREFRQKVFLIARVRIEDAWVEARIWDVSRRGMMLRIVPPAAVGSEIEVVRGPVAYRGRVVWSAGDRCGIRVDEPVDLEYLIGLKTRPDMLDPAAMTSGPVSHPPRAGVLDVLRHARSSASRTRTSLSGQLAETMQRVQTTFGR